MVKIALIDDKNYGLDQIREIHLGEDFTLEYFSSFREFQENPESFDITYLDYYLENDGITSDHVLHFVKQKSKKVIGFSSVKRRSEELKTLGADEAVQKR